MARHEVPNRPPPIERYDVYEHDRALQEAVARELECSRPHVG
jgi:hypothetical protein